MRLHRRRAMMIALAAAGAALSGCGGGSMASSSFGWRLIAVQAYGSPNVEIKRTTGSGTAGEFRIISSTPVLTAGEPIFLEANYFAIVRNVNMEVYTDGSPGTAGIPVATYSAVWSETSPGDNVLFNNRVGTTFTDFAPSNLTNVQVTGRSGTFVTIKQPGTVSLTLTVRMQFADGSSQTRDYPVSITVP